MKECNSLLNVVKLVQQFYTHGDFMSFLLCTISSVAILVMVVADSHAMGLTNGQLPNGQWEVKWSPEGDCLPYTRKQEACWLSTSWAMSENPALSSGDLRGTGLETNCHNRRSPGATMYDVHLPSAGTPLGYRCRGAWAITFRFVNIQHSIAHDTEYTHTHTFNQEANLRKPTLFFFSVFFGSWERGTHFKAMLKMMA